MQVVKLNSGDCRLLAREQTQCFDKQLSCEIVGDS